MTVSQISLQALGKNFYFLDNRVHEWIKDFPHQEKDDLEKFAKLSWHLLGISIMSFC